MKATVAHATSQRALRKQHLLMRAATERAEMAGAIDAAQQSVIFFKSAVPGFALSKGLPLALGLLKRAPLISSALPLLLAGARRPLLRYALLGAGSALLVWKGYQWLAGRTEQAPEQPAEQPADADAQPPASS